MYIVNGNRPKLSKKNTYRLMLKNNVCQQGSHVTTLDDNRTRPVVMV